MNAELPSPLQRDALLSGRGHSYFARAAGLPLSLKSMTNGGALYRIDRGEFLVDDAGYLILNEDQPYSIEIASPTPVTTFVVWFPRGWAEEVQASLSLSPDRLLDEPDAAGARPAFLERFAIHDAVVSPGLEALRQAHATGRRLDPGWLEERLRGLLARMLQGQRRERHAAAGLAARAGTRAELWRRLNRARDFLRARFHEPLTLSDAARAACLSPFHFLRSFRAVFGVTPHAYLTSCRLERARFLLERTELPVTAVCLEAGFTSLGSFSTLFRRASGASPRDWRRRHRRSAPQNRNLREEFLRGAP